MKYAVPRPDACLWRPDSREPTAGRAGSGGGR